MNVVFLGPPGAGKGTYASRLQERFGLLHISTGDLVREEIKNKTEIGKKIKPLYDEGKLVPDEVVFDLLKKRLSRGDCKNGFILDGFPRNLNQAKELEKITNIDIVINIVVPKNLVIEKLSGRRICSKCGAIYNIHEIRIGDKVLPTLKPKVDGICDKCGGKLYQREDDKPEVIEKRLKEYKKQTEPLIDYYKKKGLLKDVDGVGTVDEVLGRITRILNIKL